MSSAHPLPAEIVFSNSEALRKAHEKLDQINPKRNKWVELLAPIFLGLALGYSAYESSGRFHTAFAVCLAFAAWQMVLSLWHSNRRLEEIVSAQMVILKDFQSMQNVSKQFDS